MKGLTFREITINDKPLLDNIFHKSQVDISEYTFTNLFVWRNSRKVKLANYKDGVLIYEEKNGIKKLLPPIGFDDLDEVYSIIKHCMISGNAPAVIERVPEKQAKIAKKHGFDIEEDRDNFDYVYRVEDLAHLAGRHYDGKRGFIKKFYEKYDFECKEYTADLKDACLQLMDDWIASKTGDLLPLHNERNAIRELLDNYEALQCDGCIAHIDDRVIAFTFGEKLNTETYVVHFEKADVNYTGSYQAINQRFIEMRVLGNYEYVNREQDLGIAGMRKAKKSYQPVKMTKKFVLKLAV